MNPSAKWKRYDTDVFIQIKIVIFFINMSVKHFFLNLPLRTSTIIFHTRFGQQTILLKFQTRFIFKIHTNIACEYLNMKPTIIVRLWVK